MPSGMASRPTADKEGDHGGRTHTTRVRTHTGRRPALAAGRHAPARPRDDRAGRGGRVDRPVGARHRLQPSRRSWCPAHLHDGRLPDPVPRRGGHLAAGAFKGRRGSGLARSAWGAHNHSDRRLGRRSGLRSTLPGRADDRRVVGLDRPRNSLLSLLPVGLGLLALPGVLITTVIVALVVAPVFGVPFPVALMIGAVLASTDPAILIPLFDRLNIRPKVSQTLISESGFNDTTGAVLTLALVGAVESGQFTLSGPAWEFSKELAIGTFIGLLAGLILCYAIASTVRTGIWDEAPGVAILAVVSLAYFSNEYVGGSGYLAAFVMGLMVGNMRSLGFGQHEEHEALLE